MKIQTLPHSSPLDYQLRGNGNVPFVPISYANILQKYSSGIELTTKGDFASALDQFRSTLQASIMVVLKSQKE
jgi:hypothetical protein